jgi:hypothetical protein
MSDEQERLRKAQNMDQLLAKACESMVLMAWELFNSFKAKGFTESQAFDLTKSYVHGQAGGRLTT